jgi:uncharacterized protein (TIGR02001 family)
MNKKIILSSFASLLFLSQAANAEIKLGSAGSLSGTVGVASQYLNLGEDSNRDKPAAFASLEYKTPAMGIINPYAGIWVGQSINNRNVDNTDTTWHYEVDYILGFRTNLQKLDIDLLYKLVTVEEGRLRREIQSGEYDIKLAYPITKELTINGTYILSDTDGLTLGTTKEIKKDIWEFGFSYDLGFVKTVALYRDVAKYSENYELALQKSLFDLDFEVRYSTLDYKGIFNSEKDENNLVFSASKSF